MAIVTSGDILTQGIAPAIYGMDLHNELAYGGIIHDKINRFPPQVKRLRKIPRIV
jgi:hypothetical protein